MILNIGEAKPIKGRSDPTSKKTYILILNLYFVASTSAESRIFVDDDLNGRDIYKSK